MNAGEFVVLGLALLVLMAGWRRGFLGHRSCRVLHMRVSGRTSDVAFQPTSFHPRDTQGHPRNEEGKLQQPTCRRVLFWTKVICLLAGIIVVAGFIAAPVVATAGLAAALVSTAVVYLRHGWWRYNYVKVCRLAASPLASVLSYHFRIGAADILDGMIVGSDGVVEQIEVPSTFLSFDRNQDEVTAILEERLPGQDIEWHLEAPRPYIDLPFKVELPAPGEIRWSGLLREIQRCRPGEYVVGVDKEHAFRLSFFTHAHHAWSFATGRGKSTLLRAVVVQLLAQRRGNRVVCVDTKRVSLEPISGIPGLTYRNDPNDIGAMVEAIEDVKRVTDDRYAERIRTGRVDFPLLLLVLEEAADLDKAVKSWWSAERRRRPDPRSWPAVPPVWDSLASILRQGREVEVHVLIVTQDFDNRAYGGVGVRQNFELIVMSGWRPDEWQKIIKTPPVPRADEGKGRLMVCYGNHRIPVQAMYAEPAELLDYVKTGAPK